MVERVLSCKKLFHATNPILDQLNHICDGEIGKIISYTCLV